MKILVLDVYKDVDHRIILKQLYKRTLLQTSFNNNMLALNKGKPEQLNLKQLLSLFIEFRVTSYKPLIFLLIVFPFKLKLRFSMD